MKTSLTQTLPDDFAALKALFLEQQNYWLEQQKNWAQEQAQLLNQLQSYQEALRLSRHKRFGKSSEKDSGQGELFDEVEQEAQSEAPEGAEGLEAETEAATESQPKKARAKAGRKPLPAALPREIREYDVPEAEKVCSCGCQKSPIGDAVSEQLDIIPAQIRVIQHRRKKYACQACEGEIQVAALPSQPIPRSNATPGLLAWVAVSKYQDALPLYRQSDIFRRLNIHLPRNTLAHWMIKSSALLQPVYNLLQERLLSSGYIHMDETPVQVLNEPGRDAATQSYMWVRKTGDPNRPIILFDYFSTRSASAVETLLSDFQGTLQTDDYSGYHKIGLQREIQHLGCWAHARRKFIEAEKVTQTPKGKLGKAGMAVQLIKKLYAIEARIRDLSPEEKTRVRQQDSRAQLEKIRSWLDQSLKQSLPKSKLGGALGYLNNNWQKLTLYIEDGRLAIDNNTIENAIRPFAVQWHSVKKCLVS